MRRECRERFPPPPRFSDPDMHHGTCVTHVPWCMPGSLTSGFLWSRWRGKRSRHSRRMRNPRFCISGKRPIVECIMHSFSSLILRVVPRNVHVHMIIFWKYRINLEGDNWINCITSEFCCMLDFIACTGFVIWTTFFKNNGFDSKKTLLF